MKSKIIFPLAMLLAGCASSPNGPSVMVLPGTGLPFDQFRGDDAVCRQYAFLQVGGTTPNQAAVDSGVGSAVVGTAVGAAAGAALGGGGGAAIGAGTGLVAGSVVGTGTAQSSGYAAQQYYDIAYIQCMYAKGHRVPVVGQFSDENARRSASPSTRVPPPPPGSPPPPPPAK